MKRKFNQLFNETLNVEIGPFVQRIQRQMACYSFFLCTVYFVRFLMFVVQIPHSVQLLFRFIMVFYCCSDTSWCSIVVLECCWRRDGGERLPRSATEDRLPREQPRPTDQGMNFLLDGYPTIAYQYDPCKMCQINASERVVNRSRLCETRLVLKLYIRTQHIEL